MVDDDTLTTCLLILRAYGRPISSEGLDDRIADALARLGIPIIPAGMIPLAREVEESVHAGLPVPTPHIQAVTFAIVAGPYGDHHDVPPKDNRSW